MTFREKSTWLSIGLLWSCIVCAFGLQEHRDRQEAIIALATTEARTSATHDLFYKEWTGKYGGVYIPVSDQTQAELVTLGATETTTTTDGNKLALINPALMIEQIHQQGGDHQGVNSRLFSRTPYRPENGPKGWEKEALDLFERGQAMYRSKQGQSSGSYLKIAFPVYAEALCLECHQNKKVDPGNIFGGISMEVPLAPYYAVLQKSLPGQILEHIVLWLIGLLGLLFAMFNINRQRQEIESAKSKTERIENTLLYLSQHGSTLSGQEFFEELAQYLADVLNVDYVLIDKAQDEGQTAESITLVAHGRVVPNISYPVKGMPCEQVMGKKYCCFKEGVQSLFPNARHLNELEVESYIGVPLWNSSGQALGLIAIMDSAPMENPDEFEAILQLVAARTTTEIDRQQAEESLLESEKKYRTLFYEAAHGSAVADAETGVILACNNRLAEMLERHVEEIVGKPEWILHFEEFAEGPFSETFQTHQQSEDGLMMESSLRTKSGKLINVEINSSRLIMDGRDVLFGCFYDITERNKLMKDHKRSAQLAALGTVAAGVAHEINNPMQGIVNYATLIGQAQEMSPRIVDYTERIIKEGSRITRLTSELLHYSRDYREQFLTRDIVELISGAVSIINTKMQHSDICLETALPEQQVSMRVFPQGIQQVVVNLIDNACDALSERRDTETPKKIIVRGSVTGSKEKPYFILEVEDNGAGIPKEIVQKVKDAFFTTKPAAKGTGLGLAIVNDIIKNHDGVLEIFSTEGEGTKIFVNLPMYIEGN